MPNLFLLYIKSFLPSSRGNNSPVSSTTTPPATAARVPIPGKRNILITSALPYVNNIPHLGNIIGCVLSADVYARYCRLRGYNVLYICGTDEYGTTTETKALEENSTPKEICDKYHAIHRDVYKWFDISFDYFGRTSTPEQTEVCQAIFSKLLENNWLSENTTQQLYCDNCSKFLADRLVEGSCPAPACNYGSARGDQCEICGKLLNPTELVNPKCKVCGTIPRIRDTEHMFLELPLLEGNLREYISRMSVAGLWSPNAIHATNAWLKEGLRQRCITRDLKWGVPVPLEKFKEKVFYVWFDAPIGYISITKCYTPEWEAWWKNPENVELYQFMGKDNVPFHTIMFPSTLIGTGESWTMMKTISVTEYLNYESGKFSKSKGIGVFGNVAKATGIPVEVWRYYLLTNRPEVSDTIFTWTDLQAKLNNELINNLGNVIYRVLSFIAKDPESGTGKGSGYKSVIPDAPGAESHSLTKGLADKIGYYVDQYVEAMEKVKLKQGLKIAMSISGELNAYLQANQFWKLYKEDPPLCSIVMRTSAGVVYLLACLLEPFMPSFSVQVLKQLNMPVDELSLSDDEGDVLKAKTLWEIIPVGHRIGIPDKDLFKELEDEKVESLRNEYAGSQADRAEQEITINRLDIRVGIIKEIQKHPDADSLYVEKIDVGEEKPRTAVSGLVKYIPIEEMQNRKVCVLCNLKPATMLGIKSHAMVLCTNNSDHTKVEFVEPPQSVAIGERVKFSGFDGEPDDILKSKKVWETLQVDLHTDKDLIACFKDLPFTTSAGVCKVSSISDGPIH